MSNLEENEESLIAKMDSLCSNLNVDPAAAKKSKDSFLEIKRNYTLDVSILLLYFSFLWKLLTFLTPHINLMCDVVYKLRT